MKPQDIDAYWLQREISKAFGGQDAAQSQKLANEVFTILKVCLLSINDCFHPAVSAHSSAIGLMVT